MGIRSWFDQRTEPDVTGFAGEGVLHAELVAGTVTYRNYRALGRYSSHLKQWTRWTVLVTRQRLLLQARHDPMVDVGWTDPRIGELDIAADGTKLLVRADIGRLHADRTGVVEVRAKVADVAAVLRLVEQLRAHGERNGAATPGP